MKKQKRETLKSKRSNPLYNNSLLLYGNGKLLDTPEISYAQYNTRALLDCPFASDGCRIVCYATKGNHMFPSVIESREKSYMETKRDDFSLSIIYTIDTEKESKRYKDKTMMIRLHESGDFYSIQYLRKWLPIWEHMEKRGGVECTFYTKCFAFFLKLPDSEKKIINRLLEKGIIHINWSLDDTTTTEQRKRYLELRKYYPKANTYIATEHVNNVKHDHICDCADCAKCKTCNKSTGDITAVAIHSASKAEKTEYRKHINGAEQ